MCQIFIVYQRVQAVHGVFELSDSGQKGRIVKKKFLRNGLLMFMQCSME